MKFYNDLPYEVVNVITQLKQHGFEAYLVGGCVRDLLLQSTAKDYDITTDAYPKDIKSLFNRVIDIGIDFGTVAVIQDEYVIEITTYREGNHPRQDVRKRDFTINALLLDINIPDYLSGEEWVKVNSKVIDYVGGYRDLENKIIRTVQTPGERFKEDPLRILRGIKFSTLYGFNIESSTYLSMKNHANKINTVSKERIQRELNEIMLANKPSMGVWLMSDMGVLTVLIPELQSYHIKDVFTHSMRVLDNTPKKLSVRLAALLLSLGTDLTDQLLARLGYSDDIKKTVKKLLKYHMTLDYKTTKIAIKRLMNELGDDVYNLIELKKAGVKAGINNTEVNLRAVSRIEDLIATIKKNREPIDRYSLAVDGHDLQALGISPGPEMGEILNNLLDLVLTNPNLNEREKLLAIVKVTYLTW